MNRIIAAMGLVGAMALSGCAGAAAPTPTVTETKTVTKTETVAPEPAVDKVVKAVPGGGAYPDDFFVQNVEDDYEDLYTIFDNEKQVVDWAMDVCGMMGRGGTKVDVQKIMEKNFDGMDAYWMTVVSMDSMFNYCPQYKDRWLEPGEKWETYE